MKNKATKQVTLFVHPNEITNGDYRYVMERILELVEDLHIGVLINRLKEFEGGNAVITLEFFPSKQAMNDLLDCLEMIDKNDG